MPVDGHVHPTYDGGQDINMVPFHIGHPELVGHGQNSQSSNKITPGLNKAVSIEHAHHDCSLRVTISPQLSEEEGEDESPPQLGPEGVNFDTGDH